jgi:acyl-CoA thioesterase FadM
MTTLHRIQVRLNSSGYFPLMMLKAQRYLISWGSYRNILRSVAWAPTISLSWLWGLGFFYSISVTVEDGWLGFLLFSIPNCLGLLIFGWILGSKNINPEEIIYRLQSKYVSLFLAAQVLAVGITIFAIVEYLWQPMFSSIIVAPIGLMISVGCLIGHVSSITTLKNVHSFYLLAGAGAALYVLVSFHGAPSPVLSVNTVSSDFLGLILPIMVGFLLGPWTDLQQWQRAVQIRREGGSTRIAYSIGAVLFFFLLAINGLLATAGSEICGPTTMYGLADKEQAVALAVAAMGAPGPRVAFVIWAAIAAVSTIDSSYAATGWILRGVTSKSNSPLLAFISPKLVSSPVLVILTALLVAHISLNNNIPMLYLMAPFATILAGGAALLVADTLGVNRNSDLTLAYFTGMVGLFVMLLGYLNRESLLKSLGPVIAIVGAAPVLAGRLIGPSKVPEEVRQNESPAKAIVDSEHERLTTRSLPAAAKFDGDWFQVQLVPTYDDTNAVGNVYFANYIRWVGKARELFFNECMPRFDLSTTSYYVLTRSFHHEFRREAKEFEDVLVRIKIAGNNRKFVTLRHEIISPLRGILGRGEQSIMFLDTKSLQPVDIPRAIVEGFLPYWPKNSSFAVSQEVDYV